MACTGSDVHAVFTGHEDRVNCGSFTANGKLVVTGSNDATVRVWDPKSGKTKHSSRDTCFIKVL